MRSVVPALLVCLASTAPAQGTPDADGLPTGNLLRGRSPMGAQLVAPERLTDGRLARSGDDWQGPAAVTLRAESVLQWDLGADREIAGVALQADNNDVYVFSTSQDGERWTELFRAEPQTHPGLQSRAERVSARGRYLRLRPEGGDQRYSVSEVELHASLASYAASPLARPPWLPVERLDLQWLALWGTAALTLALTTRRSPRWWVGALLTALGGVALWVFEATRAAPRLEAPRLDWIRAVVAGLAFVAVAREGLGRRRAPAHPTVLFAVLGATAFLGVLCFLNFGRPQFYDAGRGAPTALHHYDMRTYFPIAKYFPELRFDGVYVASALAAAEGRGPGALDTVSLRDLRTHQLSTFGASAALAAVVRGRFSDARWVEFKVDMDYFRQAMGEAGYLASMQDHGGNATPVWFLGARALFGRVPASDGALWAGVAVDAALLGLAFLALGWAFGPRTALIAATVFGAMDFYMFGSNWFGAALRHDWLSLWCLGVAALKRGRPALAGAFLAWSALIRAFPAVAFVTLSAPVAWSLGVALWTQRRGFRLAAFLRANREWVRVALGALAFGALLSSLSLAVFGADAWVEWLRKVSLLNQDGHVNNLAVKTWIITEPRAWALFAAGTTALVLFTGRRLSLSEGAAFGVVLLPVVFNPANYYLHVVFLLAVLAREREPTGGARGPLAFLTLTAMCAASYFTSHTHDTGAHFRADTWVLLTALALIVAWQLGESFVADRAAPETSRRPGSLK
jgi:hypothetical protein